MDRKNNGNKRISRFVYAIVVVILGGVFCFIYFRYLDEKQKMNPTEILEHEMRVEAFINALDEAGIKYTVDGKLISPEPEWEKEFLKITLEYFPESFEKPKRWGKRAIKRELKKSDAFFEQDNEGNEFE